MRYRRIGTGRPLLLLESCSGATICPGLLEALAESHRLIVPELPSSDTHLAGWLADFLEGMGTSRMAVVAAEPLCVPAMELALLGTDQIARIVLVAGPTPLKSDGRGLAEPGLLEGATSRVSVPVLLVRCSQGADEVVALVREFLWT